MSTSKKMKSALKRALSESGITISQWAVLAALSRKERPVTAAELSVELDMDKPTVSGIVHRLIAKALVAEEASATDGRARDLVLTTAGVHTFQQCAAVAGMTSTWFLQPLSIAEQNELAKLLAKLDEERADD
ncbi:MarR family transcriptional regulator [Lacticaseibacillus pabuli]|uniref:MarR family transcriptional regulator n=1 Tax=Lacticaseibacillus pabuli TaxID=3025672 RepID=A0ABY7WSU7_9LACO|nr:MarR family transcriptional regulator [Lacticaseibacillus sp. KACC 23028]WDF83252.1 MarR family transcriptional regulator [Lacticaseibacillus sp. KACC 23028]